MKKQAIRLNITLLILTTAGCGPDTGPHKGPKTATGHPYSISPDNRVSMVLEPNPIRISTDTSAKLTVTNGTPDSLKLDERFSIESFNGKQWKALGVLEGISFNDMGYLIPPGQAKTLPITLLPRHFDYQPGSYRIRKTVKLMAGNGKLELTAPFSIR